jgi:hypothetical protein
MATMQEIPTDRQRWFVKRFPPGRLTGRLQPGRSTRRVATLKVLKPRWKRL